MATDHNFKVKNGLTVQGETLVVNHTGDLSGTQVYIKYKDSSTNLMRWGEGTSGASTYRFRIDQNFRFIGNSGSGDNIVLDSGDGSIQGTSYQIGGTTVISSSRNVTNINNLTATHIHANAGTNYEGLQVSGSNSGYTSASIRNTGSGDAVLYLDASNGDLSGSDYAWIKQSNALNLVLETSSNSGNIQFNPRGSTALKLNTDQSALFSGEVQIDSGADQILTLNQATTGWNYIGFESGGTRKFYLGNDGSDGFVLGSDVANKKFSLSQISELAGVPLITHTSDISIKPAAGQDVLLFNAHNSESQLRLYNNRQDLSNVPVSSIVSYNSVQVSKIQFYRGSGGSSGYINFQVKPQNGESLTDTFQIGDNNTVDYGVNVRAGGYRVGGTTVIDSSRVLQNTTLGHSTSGARFEANDWMYDTGNKARFYFEGSGRTFFGSDNGYVFRDSGDTGRATISDYGGINLLSGGDGQVGSTVALAVGGTTVIDSSRNLSNIGTISTSGDIDAGGRVKVTNWLELESAGAAITSEEAGIRIDYNDSAAWYIYKDNGNDAALHIQSTAASGEGDGSPRVRFNRTARETYFGGSVGINQYSITSGYSLDVNGLARITGKTSFGERLEVHRGNSNVAAPNTSNHDAGTRISFYDATATAWYAMGIESDTLWFNSDANYKWYQDASLRMSLMGSHLLMGSVNSTGMSGNSIRANGQIDTADVTTGTFRVYDGSTFRGGFGTGQWASGDTGEVANMSLYAVSKLNFHAGNQNDPWFRIETDGTMKSHKNMATTSGNTTFNVSSSLLGNIHVVTGAGANGAPKQGGITFMGSAESAAQAGLYVINNNSSGTFMTLATTDSYAAGPRQALTIDNVGNVNLNRGNLQIGGTTVINTSRNLTNIGTISSGAITSSGTVQGSLMRVSAGNPVLALNDTDATTATNQTGYISFQRQGSEKSWIGYGSSGNDDFSIYNTEGSITLLSTLRATNITAVGTISLDGSFVIDTDTGSQPFCINRVNSTSTTDNQSLRIYIDDSNAVFISEQDETNRYGGYQFKSRHNGTQYNRLAIAAGSASEVIMYNNTGSARWMWDGNNLRQGINKTNPAYTLDVDGTINGSNLRIGTIEVIDSSRNLFGVNLLKFRTHSASPYMSPTNPNTLNAQYDAASDAADLWINYRGYQDGTSYFRDFRIGDGKNVELFQVDGSARQIKIGEGTTTDLSVKGNITIDGNGEELLFTGGNNRIKFNGYRAMEGTTDGANLYIAETYSNTTVMSNLNISSGYALKHNGTTVVDNSRVIYGTAFNGTGYLYTANKALDVLTINHNATPTQYLITTNIPYTSGHHMPTVKIQGYAYGTAETVDITICWYIYNGSFTSYSASSSGAWAPEISLAQNSNGKVVIHLAEGYYYAKMSVSVESGLNMMNLTRDHMASWSWSDATCPTTNKVTVPYKQKLPGVTELDGGTLYFGNTNFGVNAGGHNLNSVYVDTLESGSSTDALELVYYQGPGVNIGQSASKYLNASTLGATTSSTPSGPGSSGQYTANGLQFGGNNNGRETNSAQISAGEHQSNSLNFVGMSTGTNASTRRMDFWVEGGAYFRGDVIATGNVTAYGSASDERLKTNIVKIENPIAKLQSVSGYTFDWNENAPEDKQGLTEYGVIAQEVEKAGLNELVFEYERPVNETGGDDTPAERWKAVHYEKFVPILIEAIKEQQEKIEKLEELVQKLISEK